MEDKIFEKITKFTIIILPLFSVFDQRWYTAPSKMAGEWSQVDENGRKKMQKGGREILIHGDIFEQNSLN